MVGPAFVEDGSAIDSRSGSLTQHASRSSEDPVLLVVEDAQVPHLPSTNLSSLKLGSHSNRDRCDWFHGGDGHGKLVEFDPLGNWCLGLSCHHTLVVPTP